MPTGAPAERYLWWGVTTSPPTHTPSHPTPPSHPPPRGGGCHSTPRGVEDEEGGVHPSAAAGAAPPPERGGRRGGNKRAGGGGEWTKRHKGAADTARARFQRNKTSASSGPRAPGSRVCASPPTHTPLPQILPQIPPSRQLSPPPILLVLPMGRFAGSGRRGVKVARPGSGATARRTHVIRYRRMCAQLCLCVGRGAGRAAALCPPPLSVPPNPTTTPPPPLASRPDQSSRRRINRPKDKHGPARRTAPVVGCGGKK